MSLKESIAKVYSTKPNRKYEGIVKRFLDIVHHNPNAYALPMLSDSIASMASELHTKDTTIFEMGHDRFVLIYEIAFQVFYFHNQYDSNRMAELFSFYIEDFKAFYVFVAVDHFFNEEFNHIVSAAEAEDLKKMENILNRIDTEMGVYLHVVKADRAYFQRCLVSRLTEMKNKKLAATIIHVLKQMVHGFITLVLRHEIEAFVNGILYDPEAFRHFDVVKIKNSLDEICAFIGVEYRVLGKVIMAMIMIYINTFNGGRAETPYLFFRRFYEVHDERIDISDLYGKEKKWVIHIVGSRGANWVYGKVHISIRNAQKSDVPASELQTISNSILDTAYAFYVFLDVAPQTFLAEIANIIMESVATPEKQRRYCTVLDSSVSLIKPITSGDENRILSVKSLLAAPSFSEYILGQKRITGTE